MNLFHNFREFIPSSKHIEHIISNIEQIPESYQILKVAREYLTENCFIIIFYFGYAAFRVLRPLYTYDADLKVLQESCLCTFASCFGYLCFSQSVILRPSTGDCS